MIKIENTPNFLGVKIIGTYEDLYELVDAFYDITYGEEEKVDVNLITLSTRLLALCYDVRHAHQGDREIEIVDNGLEKEKMKWHGIVVPETNIEYSVKVLYPEILFEMVAINRLIEIRVENMTKKITSQREIYKQKIMWDKSITTLRSLQSTFAKCVKEILTDRSYAMWLNEINRNNIYPELMYTQHVDAINIKYCKQNKEKRQKNFLNFTKQITNYLHNEDYMIMNNAIYNYAKENNCHWSEIRYGNDRYPKEYIW